MGKMKLFTMLVKNDQTVANAVEVYDNARQSNCSDFGCKDIGISKEEIKKLISKMKSDNNTTYMEMMGDEEADFVNSSKLAVECGIDVVIGGKYYDSVKEILDKSNVSYYPFIGTLVGTPRVLSGSVQDIIDEANAIAEKHVSGVTIAVYRYNGDKAELLKSMVEQISCNIVVAGSVNTKERVQELANNGIYGITIGSSFFNKDFVPNGDFKDNVNKCVEWINS
jgi:uncharacterized protein related to proFAR isomerase